MRPLLEQLNAFANSSKSSLKICACVCESFHGYAVSLLQHINFMLDTELTQFNSFEMVSPSRVGSLLKHKVLYKRIQSVFVCVRLLLNGIVWGRFHTFIYTSHLYHSFNTKPHPKQKHTHACTHTLTSFILQFHKVDGKKMKYA